MRISIVFLNSIDASSGIQATYSSTLTKNSHAYVGYLGCKLATYYEAIEVKVIETSYYTINGNSTINIDGYIYENNFDVFNPEINLITYNDYGGCNEQFEITVHLQVNTTYVLVVTTSNSNVTGIFSVLVTGPNNISFNRISEYFCIFCE